VVGIFPVEDRVRHLPAAGEVQRVDDHHHLTNARLAIQQPVGDIGRLVCMQATEGAVERTQLRGARPEHVTVDMTPGD